MKKLLKILMVLLVLILVAFPAYAIDMQQCWYHKPTSVRQWLSTDLRIWADPLKCPGLRTTCDVTWAVTPPGQSSTTLEQDTIHESYAGGPSDHVAYNFPKEGIYTINAILNGNNCDTGIISWRAETCTNECTAGQYRCLGSELQYCGHYDTNKVGGDPCVEWGKFETCQNGCSNNQCLTIACSTDAQCGGDEVIGSRYCSGDIVKEPRRIHYCTNPGTTSSYCAYQDINREIQTCTYGCTNGQCNNAPPAECGDGQDNDNDGYTDYPADLGCDSSSDAYERYLSQSTYGGPYASTAECEQKMGYCYKYCSGSDCANAGAQDLHCNVQSVTGSSDYGCYTNLNGRCSFTGQAGEQDLDPSGLGGLNCYGTKQPPEPVCNSHDHYECSEGNVFWFDSCNNKEEVKETCNLGCENDACLLDPSLELKEGAITAIDALKEGLATEALKTDFAIDWANLPSDAHCPVFAFVYDIYELKNKINGLSNAEDLSGEESELLKTQEMVEFVAGQLDSAFNISFSEGKPVKVQPENQEYQQWLNNEVLPLLDEQKQKIDDLGPFNVPDDEFITDMVSFQYYISQKGEEYVQTIENIEFYNSVFEGSYISIFGELIALVESLVPGTLSKIEMILDSQPILLAGQNFLSPAAVEETDHDIDLVEELCQLYSSPLENTRLDVAGRLGTIQAVHNTEAVFDAYYLVNALEYLKGKTDSDLPKISIEEVNPNQVKIINEGNQMIRVEVKVDYSLGPRIEIFGESLPFFMQLPFRSSIGDYLDPGESKVFEINFYNTVRNQYLDGVALFAGCLAFPMAEKVTLSGEGTAHIFYGEDLPNAYKSVSLPVQLYEQDCRLNPYAPPKTVSDVELIEEGNLTIIREEGKNLIEINLEGNELNLSELYIEKNTAIDVGSILVKGLSLEGDQTKTVYVEKLSLSSKVCLLDEEISSIETMSTDCSGQNEVLLGCPGSFSDYTCEIIDNRFKVSGLKHSAVKEQISYCGDSTCSSDESCSSCASDCGGCPSSSGGSGPSRDSSKKTVVAPKPAETCLSTSWSCGEWQGLCDNGFKTKECTSNCGEKKTEKLACTYEVKEETVEVEPQKTEPAEPIGISKATGMFDRIKANWYALPAMIAVLLALTLLGFRRKIFIKKIKKKRI